MITMLTQFKNIKLIILFICTCFITQQGSAQANLFDAIEKKTEKAVITLINKKYVANQNLKNYYYNGQPILHHAVQYNKKRITKHLITLGFPINERNKKNLTPLHIASLMGFYDLACLLVQEGADVNAPTSDMQTPLYLATQQNHNKIVAMLLQNGANPHIASLHKKTAYDIALDDKNITCISILKPYLGELLLRQPLHIAAHNGDITTVKKLINQGANVNSKDNKNATPMHYAAHKNHTEIIALLAKHGAQIDSVDDKNFNPLCVAARYGNTESVELLYNLGADINTPTTQKKFTPLHLAVKANSLKTMTFLIEKGALVNAVSTSGISPLHMAALYGYQDICQKLLQHGAIRFLTNTQGDTPFTIAMKKNHESILSLLLLNDPANQLLSPLHIEHNDISDITFDDTYIPCYEHNDDNAVPQPPTEPTTITENIAKPITQTSNHFHKAIHDKDLNEVKRLIAQKFDVNLCNKFNIPPLFYAVKQNQLEIVEELLKAGAFVNYKEPQYGATPLHFAATHGYAEIAECLIRHGAIIDVFDKHIGVTPLHTAAQGGHLETVQCLLRAGARKNIKTRQGFIPRKLAEYWQETLLQPTEISKKLIQILNPKTCQPQKKTCYFPIPKL
ncbi:MAG: hypothetical protein US69_C0002G0102 [candidate division TM6 bacterium GW2011_GWF2_38_10]|nr:MAG: hypothetical protein US69_C0002G0102 [candidate division TM6 bacterium GW2011_GWF2_38_10]